MKFKLLLTILAIVSVVSLGGCKKDDFVENVGVCPVVVSTSPARGETGVPLIKIITATFNEKMDPTSITSVSFTVRDGAAMIVSGTVSYQGQTASFTPASALVANTIYTGKMTTAAKDPYGNHLQTDYIWTFSTGTAPLVPYVVSTDPVANATNVPLAQVVTATFSEPMDAATITTAGTFTVMQGANPVAGAVTYNGNTASFTPSANFATGMTYTGKVTTFAENVLGVAMASDHIWNFSTGTVVVPSVISTDPTNFATNVPLNKTPEATFSMPMDPLTMVAANFTLFDGVTPIAGTVSYNSGTNTISLNPTVDLNSGTLYTATITTGAANLAGTPIAANYVWTFTTGSVPAPTVISTDPFNLETDVILSKQPSATFSETMDPFTLSTTTFKLMMGATVVPGIVNDAGLTWTFTPDSPLLSDTTYTATITTGAQSQASGIGLVADYVWTFSTIPHAGPPHVDLNTADRFGILAGVGITNAAGFSEIHDLDVGIYPGFRSSVVGFPPAIVVNGAIYCADDISPPGVAAMLLQAKNDLTAAYLFAEGATLPAPQTVAGDLGGMTLAPGIYKSTSTLLVQSGDLTLDAQGDVNAVWIFQIASDFTTIGGAGGNIILSGGAQAKNVFWQTGSSATIGDYTIFKGNILALTSITMNSYSVAEGRMLARNAAVTMTSTNIITRP